MFVRSSENLFSRDTWPLCLGLILIAVVPFLSIYRVGPLSSFFLEAGSLLAVLLLVVLSAFSGCLNVRFGRASYYFFALAGFWVVQAWVMDLVYPGLSYIPAWSFVMIGLSCWAVRGWVAKLGQERALSILAAVLVLGGFLQAVVGWMQYLGWASQFSGYLMYRVGIVEGQLAQRNHFGHYMMWAVLCLAWLWGQRRLTNVVAVALLLFFASVMALTGSRSVIAYVLAVAVLLPVVGWLSGCLKTRLSVGLLVAMLVVLGLQFGLESILVWFGHDVHSGAERLSGSQFGGSGRGYEWHKAWLVFLSAPWFGYGWGSYALQGFLLNIYPTGFRPYETGVLFTHSHNSLLNLLAEMGLFGTVLVVGGLLWAVSGCLKRYGGMAGLFIVVLLSVSVVHSLLEYPLWYIYFLSVFGLLVGFAPCGVNRKNCVSSLNARWYTGVTLVVCALMAGGVIRLGFAYQDLRAVSGDIPTAVDKRAKNVMGLLLIAENEPMLRYYTQLQLMNYFDPNDARIPNWAEEAGEALRYRPFANAYKWALIEARQGKIKQARDWMNVMYRYYPSKFQAYGAAVMRPTYYQVLHEDYTRSCFAYYAGVNKLPDCVKAKKE